MPLRLKAAKIRLETGDAPMRWQAFRNALVQVHLWVALILCVPMIVIGSREARFFCSAKFSPHRSRTPAPGRDGRSPLCCRRAGKRTGRNDREPG
jgi:hypothetical protein